MKVEAVKSVPRFFPLIMWNKNECAERIPYLCGRDDCFHFVGFIPEGDRADSHLLPFLGGQLLFFILPVL